jgi:hypothetical protein
MDNHKSGMATHHYTLPVGVLRLERLLNQEHVYFFVLRQCGLSVKNLAISFKDIRKEYQELGGWDPSA